MKRIIYILSCLFILLQPGYSQAIGTWETLLSYYNTVKVAESNNYVYAVAKGANAKSGEEEEGGSLFSYGKEDNSIKFYSRQDGISDQQIKLIRYNPDVNTLLIVYANGNIDLLDDKGFYNLPYLLNSSSIKVKTINDIYFHKEYAYLPGSFGIMVVNMKKKEITDTYKLSHKIYSVCIKNNELYAVTDEGEVIKGALTDNLLDNNNWKNHPTNIDAKGTIRQIILFQNTLCYRLEKKGIYYQKEDGTISPIVEDAAILSMKVENEKLIPFTSDKAYIYSSFTSKDIVNTGTINDISSLKDKNTYWIAAGKESLKGIKKDDNQYGVIFEDTLTANKGPKRNLCAYMTVNNGRLFVAGGDRWNNRYDNYGTFMLYEQNKWFNFDENLIAQKSGIKFMDITSIAIDPKDKDHYFVSTWGEGVYEFKNKEYVQLYNYKNSPLTSVYPGNPNFIRIEGLCFDKNNNLWMTNSSITTGGIKVMTPDGTWYAFGNELNDIGLIDKILITSKGRKWVNVPRVGESKKEVGIYVLDDNGTLDDPSDDTERYYNTFINIVDKKNIPTNSFYSMAEDKSGNIFIGTGNGLIICPSSVVNNIPKNETIEASRVVRLDDNGVPIGYFLDGEKINAIAVDGGNRKWIGTESSGIFLVNEDASETIENFTTDNSPILSNKIRSIAIDPVSGKVYIGTANGIISYQSNATEGSESYSDVYAYPNPVRPEDRDQVTIAGLMEDSNVKITDLSGNIIYQGKSNGGQLTWNCRNHSGKRVATGVYLVFAATPESKESVVTKIMVVK